MWHWYGFGIRGDSVGIECLTGIPTEAMAILGSYI